MVLPNEDMDFAAFDVLPAASLDDLVENIEALYAGTAFDEDSEIPTLALTGASSFRVFANNTQNVGTGPTKVAFQAASYDDNNDFDIVTNFRFDAPYDARYDFKATIHTTGGGSGQDIIISLFKNGVEASRGNWIIAGAGNSPGAIVADDLSLVAGDYVEVFMSTGVAAKATDGGTTERCHFAGHLISKAP